MKAFILQRDRWWSRTREGMGFVVTAITEGEALNKVAEKFDGKVEYNTDQGRFVSLPANSQDFQPYIYLAEKRLIA